MRYLSGLVTLALDPDLCSGCGMCTLVCPHGVLALENGPAFITDLDLCMECGACARNCPTKAVTVEAGVGCAAAVINTTLGRKNACCSLGDQDLPRTGCGGGCPEEPSSPGKNGRAGCC